MATIPYITFASNYLVERFGGKINIINNILYIENSMDEFYCSLHPADKTEKNKFRFWHKVKGQQEYHRQMDRKRIVSGMYACLTHDNKYSNIPYNRQERIKMEKEISEKWQIYKKNEMMNK